MLLSQLIDSAAPDEMTDLPCLAFVLRHSRTRGTLLFDLGIRPDPENHTGARETTAKMRMVLKKRSSTLCSVAALLPFPSYCVHAYIMCT